MSLVEISSRDEDLIIAGLECLFKCLSKEDEGILRAAGFVAADVIEGSKKLMEQPPRRAELLALIEHLMKDHHEVLNEF